MGKIYCTECGTELDDSVKFCSSCGTALSDENNASNSSNEIINKNNFTTDDMMNKMQILPIIAGIILTFIIWFLMRAGLFGVSLSVDAMFPKGVSYCLVLGTIISGYLCKNGIKFALIYGALASIIIAILLDSIEYMSTYHPEYYFLCIIAGLVGAFIGNFIRTKIKQTR